MSLQELMVEDLKKSGIKPADMSAYTLDEAVRNTCNIPPTVKGYVIPYYDIDGNRLPFYRTRLFNVKPKYRQPKDSSSFVYFPPKFLDKANYSDYIIIVEGEKKAAALMKIGIPAVSLGGVDAWRSRTLLLPADVTMKKMSVGGNERIGAKLPAAFDIDEIQTDGLALGLNELIEYCRLRNKTIIICYDNDTPVGPKMTVQRACALFAYELRIRGLRIDQIRQWVLPANRILYEHYGKIAVDDFIREVGYDEVHAIIDDLMSRPSAFPRHPNIELYVGQKLRGRLTRKDYQTLSLAILSDLDANGKRLRFDDADQLYYFDKASRQLMKVHLTGHDKGELFTSRFGIYLYRKYGLTSNDTKILNIMNAQFAGEAPIEDVTPYRIYARPVVDADTVIYQLNDAQYVRISSNRHIPIEICDNGDHGILFESGHVDPVDGADILQAYQDMKDKPLMNWWDTVLTDTRLMGTAHNKMLTTLLYYVSPWLYRWRGTQLPVEVVYGESGCGKSSLCELRLSILTGKPKLRNAPGDLKDWNAAIANSGGIHVTDNVQLKESGFRNRLSDELCRLVTEPDPSISMRKYYTETGEITIPITSVFVFTAIEQPFTNPDILQRSFMTELGVVSNDAVSYNSNWKADHLNKHGGRAAWLVHQFLVLHKFFRLVETKWDSSYAAKSRLINLEQILMLMAEVLQMPSDWIPDFLVQQTHDNITTSDNVFTGLKQFKDYWSGRTDIDPYKTDISLNTITSWCSAQDSLSDVDILTNPRKLAPYFKANKHKIATIVGIVFDRHVSNKQVFRLKTLDH